MAAATFQDQVDRCLTALEAQQPTIHRLRRVPMDLIAEAVEKDLGTPPRGLFARLFSRAPAVKDAAVQRALVAIAVRNRAIVAEPIRVPRY